VRDRIGSPIAMDHRRADGRVPATLLGDKGWASLVRKSDSLLRQATGIAAAIAILGRELCDQTAKQLGGAPQGLSRGGIPTGQGSFADLRLSTRAWAASHRASDSASGRNSAHAQVKRRAPLSRLVLRRQIVQAPANSPPAWNRFARSARTLVSAACASR